MGSPGGKTDIPDETEPGGATGSPDETAADPRSVAQPELAAGASLGKYRLVRVLGRGGMGVVWAAHDPDLERAIALKVLRQQQAVPEQRRRLLREARAMARLKHPNVLTVYEVDSEAGRDFIAMELVEGTSLDGWLAGGPPRAEVWPVLLAAGRGLAAAHRAGLVHRDFKPHNVLRSDDGRVLVTDFGLARGHDDGQAAAAATEDTLPVVASGLEDTVDATPGSGESARNPRLTHTGAVLGTPAYMAPEQFAGAAPDPRTDQFAYCVTAWQLLTGERPFRGASFDELRRAANSGVADVPAKLPRAVRAVLARGLDPDPARRWPDMNALLAALERARTRPQRWRRVGVAAVGLVLAAVLAVKLGRAPSSPSAAWLCALAPEDEMAKAWSPALRASLAPRFDNSAAFAYVAGELDGFAARWSDDYRAACAGPGVTRTFAKLGCLLGERDEVAGLVALFPTLPAAAIRDVEMSGALPRPEACDGDTPVTPPTLPEDPDKRARIQALRPRLIATRFAAPEEVLAAAPGLLAEAQRIGWDPIVAEAHQAAGIAAQRAGKHWELGRDHFKSANQIARRTHHYHLEAETWIGLLDGEFDAASDPADASAFAELVAQARLAAHNAGDDPVFLARISIFEGAFAFTRGRFDEAMEKLAQAGALARPVNDLRTWFTATIARAHALLQRNRPDDLAAAWALLLDAEQVARERKVSTDRLQPLTAALSLVAELRGDPAAAHAWADRATPPHLPPGVVAVHGRVVDADGHGVAGAVVVAWRGSLEGDATRAYVRGGFEGDVAVTGADGGFTVRAVQGGGIIAERGAHRSRPRPIGDAALTLTLGATREVTGTLISDAAGMPGAAGALVLAHYQLGPALAWACTAPVDSARGYRLAGLPDGDATLRLDTRLDQSRPIRKLALGPVRNGAELRWPIGALLDVIVRGAWGEAPSIYVLRTRRTAKTRADLDRLFAHTDEAMIDQALVIGLGDQTAEAMTYYARGDRHAVFHGMPPGDLLVCAANEGPASPATCQRLALPAAPPEARDRGRGPAVPLTLQR